MNCAVSSRPESIRQFQLLVYFSFVVCPINLDSKISFFANKARFETIYTCLDVPCLDGLLIRNYLVVASCARRMSIHEVS